MRVLIVGAGAVGGFLAARLVGAGDDVAVLVRPARAEGLRREGLRIREGLATTTYAPRVLTASELRPEFDLVVLAVKSEAIATAIEDMAPAVGPETAVVPFLNGMRHVEPLVSRFGNAVLGGTLRVATEPEDDGAIRVLSPIFEVEIGELASPSSHRLDKIAVRFTAAGAEVAIPDDIVGAMWTKWVFIASIGAATSLMRASVGEIIDVPSGAAFARAILHEAAGAAAAAGHPVPSDAFALTEQALTTPGVPTTSSMSRDLLAGRHTEVEPILGDLVERADETATPTPLIALATLALRIHNRQVDAAAGPSAVRSPRS